MTRQRPLRKLSFLHIVPYQRDDPARGLDEALRLFEYAEELGLDGGWVRTRHLQYGLPSAATFLAAASQRTNRIDLGAAVIPTVYESEFRLAEDLSVADLLSGGRLQPGLSVGSPRGLSDDVAERILGPDWRDLDTSHARIERILDFIKGEPPIGAPHPIGLGGATELSSDRVEPHAEGLASRIWYGAGSFRSTEWAAAQGLKLLVSNISHIESSEDFDEAQRAQIDRFRAHHPLGEDAVVSQGHVLVPTDDASDAQRERFAEYVSARTPRTSARQASGALIAADVHGSTEQILDRLLHSQATQAADEFLFELPFQFAYEDYRHILEQVATVIGPALGWSPTLRDPAS
ncbi:MAG: LLM class flavin-dependent oxidoreductase [Microbacterium sp.]|uniref:LLM class flavin-dependent oxidoreductase n=1 Tax=Microbacterium sp. TaxID=51671 RepID=UPI0039E5B4EC